MRNRSQFDVALIDHFGGTVSIITMLFLKLKSKIFHEHQFCRYFWHFRKRISYLLGDDESVL